MNLTNKQLYDLNEYRAQMQVAAKSGGAAERDFYNAAEKIKLGLAADDMLAYYRDGGEPFYTEEQVNKAAMYAREDAAVAAHLQLAILKRLDRNQKYMVVVILMLGWLIVR